MFKIRWCVKRYVDDGKTESARMQIDPRARYLQVLVMDQLLGSDTNGPMRQI